MLMIKYICIILSCFLFLNAAQNNKNSVDQALENAKNIVTWNYSGRVLKPKNSSDITVISFFPSGNRLAFRSREGIQIWDVQSDSCAISRDEFPASDWTLDFNSGNEIKIIFSQCHNFMIAHSPAWVSKGEIEIWSLDSGEHVKKIKPVDSMMPIVDVRNLHISSFALSPCGNSMIFALKMFKDGLEGWKRYPYGGLWAWVDKRKKIEDELEKVSHYLPIKDIRDIIINYVSNRFEDFVLEKVSDIYGEKISCSPSGQYIARVSDSFITVSENGIEHSCQEFGETSVITFYPNSKTYIQGLASGDVVSCSGSFRFKAHKGPVTSLVFSRCGKFIISASTHEKSIRVWNSQSGECIKDYEIGDYCNDIAVSLCGRYIACALKAGRIILFTKET